MLTAKRILVPIDFSEHSEEALKQAIDFAGRLDATVYVLHVVEEKVVQCIDDYCLGQNLVEQLAANPALQYSGDSGAAEGLVDKVSEHWFKSAKENIQRVLERVPGAGQVKIVPDVRRGNAYQEIVRDQQEKKIDLIIMPSFGKSGIKEFYLGSTAARVVRHATCSVVIVRKVED